MPATRVPLLFGTMTMGEAGKNGVRTSDLKECQEIVDVFFKHGHRELDTARMYAEGTTEPLLSRLGLPPDVTIDTKAYPANPGDHAPAALRATFQTSLKQLAPFKVRVFYLHAPDRSVPFEETLREVNELYKEGLFQTFGLSNYASWEVAEIVGICKAKGWVQPRIYQAMYNAVTREMEAELVPCCRKFGLRIVIYNPLAGGFFAGKVAAPNAEAPKGGRFDPSSRMGAMYRARYLKSGYFEALNYLKPIAEKHQLRLTEIALRWCQHHSVLTPEDGVILGASSAAQLEQNCTDSEKGPLPEEVVKALDHARLIVGAEAPTYWR
ncbi:Aldo/keto reductase [Laetiporus sulphureus 93-53]|uniref:Aldo/keto reductase n=1 Tax=Laetiporus sulphureus 93-53 TaxID=1314785 RepID=A0A165H7Y0_9APHY|nr:Aldo/keto reductase [Laetiporus sulphureus 93-53]KZT11370.1 Aldo/keto reductase [Laetiporus sulphureus 93-53]